MRQCYALAAVACLLAAGCTSNGLFAGKGCGDGCCDSAPRRARTCLFEKGLKGGGACCGATPRGARTCMFEQGCQGCAEDCAETCDEACACGDECCNDGCRGLVNGIAGGFCKCCPVCGCTNGLCPHAGGYPEQTMYNQGPPTGQVAYPYYTVRGPRDFLACKPQSIGPN